MDVLRIEAVYLNDPKRGHAVLGKERFKAYRLKYGKSGMAVLYPDGEIVAGNKKKVLSDLSQKMEAVDEKCSMISFIPA